MCTDYAPVCCLSSRRPFLPAALRAHVSSQRRQGCSSRSARRSSWVHPTPLPRRQARGWAWSVPGASACSSWRRPTRRSTRRLGSTRRANRSVACSPCRVQLALASTVMAGALPHARSRGCVCAARLTRLREHSDPAACKPCVAVLPGDTGRVTSLCWTGHTAGRATTRTSGEGRGQAWSKVWPGVDALSLTIT